MASTHGTKHLTASLSLSRTFDRQVTTETYQGDQDDIKSYVEGLSVGDYTSKWGRDAAIITGISMRRLNGKVCEATIQSTKIIKVAIWGFDFHQLSKPTITFRYNGETDATVNVRAKCIRGWEALRDANRLPEYMDFKYIKYNEANEEIGVGNLSDQAAGGANTLSIAQKLMRGQESYNVYYPVITLTRTSDDPFTDDLGAIGHQSRPSTKASGWKTHGNPAQIEAILALKAYWVKTADNIGTNPDATFTRREQWTGMDDLDKDFYPTI